MSVLYYLHLCNELVTWGRQENENYLFHLSILDEITKEVKVLVINSFTFRGDP